MTNMDQNSYPKNPILLVDDDNAWLESLAFFLSYEGFDNLMKCREAKDVAPIMDNNEISVVILDLVMPGISGESLLETIVAGHPEVPVIILSGMDQVDTAVNCLKKGAFDYFVKTSKRDKLVNGIKKAIELQEAKRENIRLRRGFFREELVNPECFSDVVTQDKKMYSIFRYTEAIAPSSQPVLISGETGTGKEVLARAIYKCSGREGPFTAVNVAGLDDQMFSDTLFGHTKGAFTGAQSKREGMVTKAANGILFLDEIGDLTNESQVKLLRLVQEKEYFPLGSDTPKKMNASIVAATHTDLHSRMQQGLFRRDLYYRLSTHHIYIPPLRERLDDIPLLVEHFLKKYAQLLNRSLPQEDLDQIANLLQNYDFPGNVRELESLLYDAFVVSSDIKGILDYLQDSLPSNLMYTYKQTKSGIVEDYNANENPFQGMEVLPSLHWTTELLVQEAMRRSNGNVTQAAKMLGISRQALSKRLKQN